ncbi:hypothetical protein LEP1GSC061_1785 [Leptospira wolffii serovar Khorat str. Khorat-H2]|nr:hypothetical protein LEP1GSC061_1785 [Leptospira wolffii serovar Khorat str. Khorat-H2]
MPPEDSLPVAFLYPDVLEEFETLLIHIRLNWIFLNRTGKKEGPILTKNSGPIFIR